EYFNDLLNLCEIDKLIATLGKHQRILVHWVQDQDSSSWIFLLF
ncbi:39988_t:CDS:1, partial [Gigaspora margarita]